MPTTVIHPRRLLIGVLALFALAIAVLIGPGRAEANTKCPNPFRVLHNDDVGKLSLRAGSYRITVINQNELSCQRASDLFAKFLQDFDGRLPGGWKVKVQQSGFVKSPQKGFFVKRTGSTGSGGGGGGRHPAKGEKICPGTFQVQHNDRIGDLHLRKGPYKITVIKKRRISCQKASSLFTRFLAKPSGLPHGWKLKVQSATFLKKGKHFGFRVKQA
jgi:hypothetical protein